MPFPVYFQIIITLEKSQPIVFLLRESDLDFDEVRKMEEQVGNFPEWCCYFKEGKLHFREEIDDFRHDQNIFGRDEKPRIIVKTLWYNLHNISSKI